LSTSGLNSLLKKSSFDFVLNGRGFNKLRKNSGQRPNREGHDVQSCHKSPQHQCRLQPLGFALDSTTTFSAACSSRAVSATKSIRLLAAEVAPQTAITLFQQTLKPSLKTGPYHRAEKRCATQSRSFPAASSESFHCFFSRSERSEGIWFR
jgi:hypothetical protein